MNALRFYAAILLALGATASLSFAENSPACAVKELKKNAEGLRAESPDGRQYLVNKEDAQGIPQLYVGATGSADPVCITCVERPGGPKVDRFKMQPRWHPSGRWIFLAVERDEYAAPPLPRDMIEGILQSGVWVNMYVVSPDGQRWHRLTDFQSNVANVADGYTGPAATSDGKTLVWSQIMPGSILIYYPFGLWQLTKAEFVEVNGVPTLANIQNITPTGMHWNEIGVFHPDDESLGITGSTESDAQGMDQYILNIRTGQLTNLTNSPTTWDEHGVFSPDGEKIIFMSAYPYRDDPNASKIATIKTEFMLMNKDGSGLQQLTHFKEPGYPEFGEGIAANPVWSRDGRSANLRRLVFPGYEDWTLTFQGPCGKKADVIIEPPPNGGTGGADDSDASLAAVRVRPNPWRVSRDAGTRMTFEGMHNNSTVKIFTLSGRWVATLAAPNGSVAWNVKTDSNDAVASGLYFYLVTDAHGHKTRGKFAIIQ